MLVFKNFIRQRKAEAGDDTSKQSMSEAVVNQLNDELDSAYLENPEPDEIIITVTIISTKNQ